MPGEPGKARDLAAPQASRYPKRGEPFGEPTWTGLGPQSATPSQRYPDQVPNQPCWATLSDARKVTGGQGVAGSPLRREPFSAPGFLFSEHASTDVRFGGRMGAARRG